MVYYLLRQVDQVEGGQCVLNVRPDGRRAIEVVKGCSKWGLADASLSRSFRIDNRENIVSSFDATDSDLVISPLGDVTKGDIKGQLFFIP